MTIEPVAPSETAPSAHPGSTAPRKPRTRRTWRYLAGLSLAPIILFVAYLMAAWVLSRIPVNAGFEHTVDGIEIAVLNNGVHCDLALPLEHDVMSWRRFLGSSHPTSADPEYQYVLIGWGNRRFYLETPHWKDLQMSVAAGALTGLGDTVVHVDSLKAIPNTTTCRRIRISADQYRRLCDSLKSSFATQGLEYHRVIPGAAYSRKDAFYIGTGCYSVLNTCNVWAGRHLQHASIRTGWWTPFAGSLFDSLPAEPPPNSERK